MQQNFSKYWPWFFFAAAFQSLVPITTLLLIPTEGGISNARLLLLSVLFLFLIVGIFLGWIARNHLQKFDKYASTPYLLSSTLLALTSICLLFLLRYLNPQQLLPYYERINPLLWYTFFISSEFALFSLLLKYGFHLKALSNQKQLFVFSLIAFCILFFVFLFVSITKIGITPDTAYWGEPGVPIQGWHFIIATLLGFVILLLFNFHALFTLHYARIANYVLPVTLYLITLILWLRVPLQTLENSFYSPISPPANIPFPYSDAGFYDYLSQSLLIGTDYLNNIPPRPLYVTFLALLHFLFGQNYPAIITAQVCVLALFPVVLYFLGKKTHTPTAGVLIALFAIFREYTNLWIASNTRVANSKIFTTDFSTAFAIALMCLIAVWWLEKRNLKSTLIAGGAFGLMLLFRTQSTITLPVLLILVLFVLQFKWLEWIKTSVIFGLVMIVSIAPWLIHNYTIAGQFSFDDPKQVAVIYSQYSFTGNLDISQFDPTKDSASQRILSFALENPVFVATFITSHFLNTEIGGLLTLPLIKPFYGLFEPVNLYWMEWNGSLEWYNLVLIIFYLVILAFGFGSAWKKLGWLGLIPLAFNVGYALSNGIARFSSWRYNLPIDWVIYFYFGIGLIEIFTMLISLFRNTLSIAKTQISYTPISPKEFRPQYIFILLFFAFIGASPWLAKGYAPPRYTASQTELISKLANNFDAQEIESFLTQPQATLLEGRMLYPRMYWSGDGLSSTNPWRAYKTQNFPRMGFILINQERYDLIFPTKELLNFQQGADTIVLACNLDGLLYVRAIQFEKQAFQSDSLITPCP